MPQAIEWSLATPMISPRFPSINPGMFLLSKDVDGRDKPGHDDNY